VWNIATKDEAYFVSNLKESIESFSFTPDSKRLASSRNRGPMTVWSLA
jgi:hypothetical protein